MLALGFSLATVALAVVDGVLFRPLPYDRSDELFVIRAGIAAIPRPGVPLVSGREISAWRNASPETPMTAVRVDRLLAASGPRERITVEVDEHLFNVLGVRPLIGGFAQDDFDGAWRDDKVPVMLWPKVISAREWRAEHGSNPGVAGRVSISRTDADGRQFGTRLVGVMPDDFLLPVDGREVAMLTPLTGGAGLTDSDRQYHVVIRIPRGDVGRVRDRLLNATMRVATESSVPDAHATGQRLQQTPFDIVDLLPVREHLTVRERPAFGLVLAATMLLLLLASVNVAGLAVARSVERRTTVAIRRALGASRSVLVRGLFVETAVLVVVALGVAWLLAGPLLAWTVSLLPPTVAILKEPVLDVRVLGGAAGFALACLTVVTAWPALVATRVDPWPVLSGGSAGAPRLRRTRTLVVSAQVAMGFVLLIAGGLTIVSAANAHVNETGFHRHHLLLFEVFAQRADATPAVDTLRGLPDVLTGVPGVRAVAVSTINPLFAQRANGWTEILPAGWSGDIEGVVSRRVSANFFDVIGLRLVDGRWPAAREWAVDQPVALVSQTAARVMWPDRTAIGQVLVPRNPSAREPSRVVIGVVADARFSGLDVSPVGDVYLPDPLASEGRTGVFFHVSTTESAAGVLGPALASLGGRNLRIAQALTHEDALFASIKHRVLPAWLFGSLGAGALVMLATGVLALLAMTVAQRSREVGIRMALGATPGRVVSLMFREQMAAVAMGLGGGAVLAAWTVPMLDAWLYGVRADDPAVWMTVAVVLALVAAAGTLLPALRAARVSPAHELRNAR